MGPLSIARALLDSVPLLKASLKAPTKILPFLEIGKMAAIELSMALLEKGAEILVIEDMDASPDLLHPKTYKSMVMDYQKQVIQAVPAKVILHVCGDVTLVSEEMAKTGACVLSIDPKAETHLMRTKLGNRVPLMGGVDTISLSLSSPQQIKAMCLKALRDGINIFAPGCAVPPDSPSENLKAIVEVAQEFSINS